LTKPPQHERLLSVGLSHAGCNLLRTLYALTAPYTYQPIQLTFPDVFPALIKDGEATPDWKYVRQWTGSYTNSPVTDVDSLDIRCNVDATTGNNTSTLGVAAGSTIGFTVKTEIGHPGPLLVYMAKAPTTAAAFDGSGESWFKIYEDGPKFNADGLTWPTEGMPRRHLPRYNVV
jgi:hypothetical protein